MRECALFLRFGRGDVGVGLHEAKIRCPKNRNS